MNQRADASMALLWERVREKGDMPGFTKAIGAILGAMRGEDEHSFDLAQTVLTDPVLTQKVLRLANSGMYAAFGQRINTVSKAVLVLGTEAIGHLALGLKLIEELGQIGTGPHDAHVEMEKAVLAGMVAQQVASNAGGRDPEEAVVCSMLHALGRMIIAYYLPECWNAMQQHSANAPAVLGLSVEAIGRAAAEHWGLPANLTDSMRCVVPAEPGEAFGHADWLAALSSMASQCAESLWHDDAAGAAKVRALAGSYSAMLGVAPERILQAVEQARVVAANDLSIAPLAKPAEKRARALASSRQRAEGNKILLNGVSDMRDALASATPGQMMSMALETVYQGLGFGRALAFQRNWRDHNYAARMGFGDGVKSMLPALTFDDSYEANVFHAALDSDRAIYIERAREPAFAAKLPGWWKAALGNARSFMVLPLCSGGHPAGFIYGDWDDSYPAIQLSQTEFALLNDLRALIVKTFERRQQLELATARMR